VNIDSPTVNGYPKGRLSANAGQAFAEIVFKVAIVVLDKLAEDILAKVARYGEINALVL